MSASQVVVLVAAVVACGAALVGLVAAVVLAGQVRRLERAIEELRAEAVPLVSGARQAVDHATAELARVEAVLEDTESVTHTVASASALAQRAFANPIVKVLALRAGAATGLRALRDPAPTRHTSAPPAADRRRAPTAPSESASPATTTAAPAGRSERGRRARRRHRQLAGGSGR